jgi:hypothetical protein
MTSRRRPMERIGDLLPAAARELGLDLDEIFDLAHYTRHAGEVIGRLDAIVPVSAPA